MPARSILKKADLELKQDIIDKTVPDEIRPIPFEDETDDFPDEPRILSITAHEDDAGKRLDAWCAARAPELSRSRIKLLIGDEDILINGKKARPAQKLNAGDLVTITLKLPTEISARPQDIPIEIVYQDADVIVVNKPQGMVVHPAHGTPDGTLVNALLYHVHDLSGIGGELRPGIVHRIDKDTSGLLMAAKNDAAHKSLAAQLKDHSVTREYVALVKGILPNDSGKIDMPIGRDPKNRKRMTVTDRNAKEAVTRFEVLQRYTEGYTLCRFRLETGRTHQIRVHMKHIGYPIAGDPLYGGEKRNPFPTSGQLLHARKLGFVHPSTGKYMEFTAELPEAFARILDRLTPYGDPLSELDATDTDHPIDKPIKDN